jgi:hypothetical protein
MTTKTSRPTVSDFLKWYVEERYCFVTGTIKNVSGGAINAGAMQPGAPVSLNSTQWETLASGAEADAEGFWADNRITPALANNAISSQRYRILKRGPAIINADCGVKDYAGTAYVAATIATKAEALSPPVAVLRDNATSETQET